MAKPAIEQRAPGLLHIHLEVVPGASKEGLAGAYGDRLKIRVTAPAESGKANKAVLALLAATLGIPSAQMELVRGAGLPLKTVAVLGLDAAAATTRLLAEAR